MSRRTGALASPLLLIYLGFILVIISGSVQDGLFWIGIALVIVGLLTQISMASGRRSHGDATPNLNALSF